jgi:hypothetical protein
MKQRTSASLRKLAADMADAYPEMAVHDHLRDAARELDAGRTNSSQRHLNAAIFGLQPVQLRRHGVHDDAGHMRGKAFMQQAHRHLLLVKDIEDIHGSNRAIGQERRDERDQQAQERAMRTSSAPAPPPMNVAASWGDVLGAIELAAVPHHETAAGRSALKKQGKTAYGTSYPVPNVSYLHKALKAVGRVKPGKRGVLKRFLQKRAGQLGVAHHLKGTWAEPGAKTMGSEFNLAAYGIEDHYLIELRYNPDEVRDRHGRWQGVPGMMAGTASMKMAQRAGLIRALGASQSAGRSEKKRKLSMALHLKIAGAAHRRGDFASEANHREQARQLATAQFSNEVDLAFRYRHGWIRIGGGIEARKKAEAARGAGPPITIRGKKYKFVEGPPSLRFPRTPTHHFVPASSGSLGKLFQAGSATEAAAAGTGMPLESRVKTMSPRKQRAYKTLRARGHSHSRAMAVLRSIGKSFDAGKAVPPAGFATPTGAAPFRVVELFNPAGNPGQARAGAGIATGGQFIKGSSGGAAQKKPAPKSANQQAKSALLAAIQNDRARIETLRRILKALASGRITALDARNKATQAGQIGKAATSTPAKKGAPAKRGAAAISAAGAKAKTGKAARAKKAAGPLSAASEAAAINRQISTYAREIASYTRRAAALSWEDVTDAIELAGPKGYRHGWIKDPAQMPISALTGKHVSRHEAAGMASMLGARRGHVSGGRVSKQAMRNEAVTGVAGIPGPFGRHLSGKEAKGFSAMFGGDARKQKLYAKLRKGGASHSKAQAVLARARNLATPLDLVGPKGYIHGWIKVDPTKFAAGLQPGSFEHLRAIEDLGAKAVSSDTAPGNRSTTLQTALHNLAHSLAGRDMKSARIHLEVAKQANVTEASGMWTRDLAELEKQMDRVPKQATGWRERTYSPISRRAAHPGHYVGTRLPSNPTRGALRIPQMETVSSVSQFAAELSAQTGVLSVTPAPRGKPGGPGLYDVKGLGHTPYLQQIVKALIEKRGMSEDKAYAIARAAIRRWAAGGGKVHPEVRAAAGKAEAGELEKQARAKAA